MVLGRSFVQRLHLEVNEEGMDLRDKHACVDIRGVGGMHEGAVCRHLEYVKWTRPTVIYLDIGTNDLSSPRCDPCVLADTIYDCARELGKCPGVRYMIIGEGIGPGILPFGLRMARMQC